MSFGNRLRNLRLENNMTQEDLSKKLSVSRATVGRYETNERFPDKNILMKLADIFEVSTDYLLGRTDNRNSYIEKETNFNKYNHNCETYKKLEERIRKSLLNEGIISEYEPVSKDMLEKVFKYGIEAAVEIIRLEREGKGDNYHA